jgi:dipeptidase E
MGGGGFTMGERAVGLDRLVLELTGRPLPRICFLPTASGDPREQITRFHERFDAWPCQPSTLSLFHLGRDRVDPATHLLAQDAIYVGGGSMRNMLAIWREHGVDAVMRTAWERGIVLAGLSAGAMCWCEAGVSMSAGAPQVVRGLGLLPDSLSVHRSSEPERLPVYAEAVATGALAPGYAVDDGAALIYHGVRLARCVRSDPTAEVERIDADGDGGVRRTLQPVHLLSGSSPGRPPAGDDADGVAELRALRAGRHRWD